MNKTVGQCGVCGGQVVVPILWAGTNPPDPQCEKCHRFAAPLGPVLTMREPQPSKNDQDPR